jgi:uncharacterized BrkB/YihY/UPF0761 family membrane protein
MKTIQLVALTAMWFFVGTQSYIYWVNKYNRTYYKKWRKTQIDLIPLMGLLGPIGYIAGLVIFNSKNQ